MGTQTLKKVERSSQLSQRKLGRIPSATPQGFEVDNHHGRVWLPKLGWRRYRKSQDILGEVKNATVSESCGKWFVSIQTEREVEIPQHPSTSAVGVEWGVVNFATLSEGEVVHQCQPLKKFLPKLAKLQRRLARKQKFSKNWKKAKAKATELHTKIANDPTKTTPSFVVQDPVYEILPNVSPWCQEPAEGSPAA